MITPRQSAAIHPLGSEFDRFLYASVGDDRRGGLLSVVSALARVGVDPWEQAAILARLPADGAVRALSALLARLPAEPGEQVDPVPLATHLVTLLPRGQQHPKAPAASIVRSTTPRVPSAWDMALLGLVVALLLLGVNRLMESRPEAPTAPVVPAPPAPYQMNISN